MAKTTKTKETAKKMTSAPEKAMTKAPKAAALKAATKAILAKEVSKKKSKKSEKIEVKALETPASENTEEEDEDAEGANTNGAQSSGLALAAATADTAASTLKNFRHHPDIENFYRFIYENDLRYEALEIIDVIAVQREAHRKTLKAMKNKH